MTRTNTATQNEQDSDAAQSQRFLASDNTSGMCAQAMDYLAHANSDDQPAYGNDDWTARACDRFRELFETDCDVYFTFNGTAANSLALASMCRSYNSVISHDLAHIETDECGGPEFFSNGAKLLTCPGENGRLTPAGIDDTVTRRNDIHYPRPKVVSVTQSTEVGTVYNPTQMQAIRDIADHHNLRIHMDGARFANACASLEASPADLSWRAGVDVLCFSGTKNGLAFGEAVVFFDHELAEDFDYRCKQSGQLASKMRFLSAPWLGLLETDAWRTNARHANEMARRLAAGIQRACGLVPMFPVEANAVFLELSDTAQAFLRQRGWQFYTFIAEGGVRFVCSWSTWPETIDALIDDIVASQASNAN